MDSVLKRYAKLAARLRQEEAALAEIRERQEQLVKIAQGQVTEATREYESQLQDLDENERTVRRYQQQAQRFASLGEYTPRPEEPNMNELYRNYTVIAGPIRQAHFYERIARTLLENCENALAYFRIRRGQINTEIRNAQSRLMERPEIRQCAQQEEAAREKIARELLPELNREIGSAAELMKPFAVEAGRIYHPAVPETVPQEMVLGYADFPDPNESYHADGSGEGVHIRIPFGMAGEAPEAGGMYDARQIHVLYNDDTRSVTHKIVQSLAFNILRNYPPLCGRITYVDFGTFNEEFLSGMRCFTEPESLIDFPQNANQADAALSRLEAVSSSEPEDSRHRRYLIIRDGADQSAGSKFNTLLQNLANNAVKNNIVIIRIYRKTDEKAVTFTSAHSCIYAKQDQFWLTMPETDVPFHWFDAPGGLEQEAVDIFQQLLIPKKIGNEYENFFPLNRPINYVRDRRPITLPYGMDDKGNILNLTFEGMNFASFIMGASGSGKSTLIHALIAGIIQNYHPDEVELWLADLKMMEFANYTHHMPPHVKYVLMDSSREMVYDFIDLLHAEMERRQVLLAAYGTNDCKNLPRDKYLPTLFIIIDEFSTLSDIIRDDDAYKRKLEQILVRGRGPGLRLIFASQSYTDGAPALTKLAKNQIQTRIAMKNTPEEIKLTMELTSDEMTDAVRHQINTLPEHYVLRRVQEKSGLHRVDKAHCLYFNGRDEEGWKSRFELIDRLSKMKPVSVAEFDPDKIDQYVEKKPIVVSGKSLQAFDERRFGQEVMRYKREPDNIVFDEDILVRFGQPRTLSDNLFTVLTNEGFENILLMAGNKELTCGMSVALSAMRSFRYHNGQIQVWAHPRNRMYHWYKDPQLAGCALSLGLEAIRESIDELRTSIQRQERGNQLIVLLGMENICPDLTESAADGFSVAPAVEIELVPPSLDAPTAPAVAPMEDTSELEERCMRSAEDLMEMFDAFYDEQSELGKSDEEIDEAFEKLCQQYMKTNYDIEMAVTEKPKAAPGALSPIQKRVDYLADFQQLLRVGSRWGYHFLVYVPNYQSIQMMGLNVRMFNHRISFKTDSSDTSMSLFNNSSAYRLPEHTCYYAAFGSSEGSYAITPYLHRGVTWNNWTVDENGIARDQSRL